MRRRAALALAAGLAALLTVDAARGDETAWRERAAQAAAPDERPNIVVVMTDDADRRAMRRMPVVRREIAGRGVEFRDASAAFPLCCPSRASFLSGQFAHNSGAVEGGGNRSCVPQFDASSTVATSLADAGYRNVLVGKYLNGWEDDAAPGDPAGEAPPGWSRFLALVRYDLFDWALSVDGKRIRQFGNRARDYQTDVLARLASQQTAVSAKRRKPFFLMLSTHAPHGESGGGAGARDPRPAPRHQGEFNDVPFPEPPSFNEADVSDKPSFLQVPELGFGKIQNLKRRFKGRGESLLAVDEAVARIRDRLRAAGELSNTIFVFTSDNGFMLGEHRLAKKTLLYEESAGVPLAIRGPGFRGRDVDVPVTSVDLAATVLEAAGAAPPKTPDGVALQAIASDPEAYADRHVLTENRDGGAPGQVGASVRSERWTYIRQRVDGQTYEELYDRAEDHFQLTNLATDPGYAAILGEMRVRLTALESCAGAACG
ncbi:sulfatase [Thermoleophilia bacterium SCSIO 60948]|nr:sulfatase [Thermoleophilia bacterium SCSIO 60948]